MTTKAIRQKLLEYIASADDKKVKAMYTLLENEINPPLSDWDEELEREMDKRLEGLKNGTEKGYTWEEAKEMILNDIEKPYTKK